MKIDKIISKIRNLKESAPTNSVGSNGYTNDGSATALGGFNKFLFKQNIDLLSQDYQTPGQTGLAKWRFSNVYPVQKVTEKDIDDMVDASKEYTRLSTSSMDTRLKNLIDMVKSLREQAVTGAPPTNNVGSGNIAGTREAGDDPPVKKKKKKKYIYGGRGSRRMWLGNNG
tara:strand:+ start:466 stop:975 length:510 start_codon:yes stop_codon:yes gene_type:complete